MIAIGVCVMPGLYNQKIEVFNKETEEIVETFSMTSSEIIEASFFLDTVINSGAQKIYLGGPASITKRIQSNIEEHFKRNNIELPKIKLI